MSILSTITRGILQDPKIGGNNPPPSSGGGTVIALSVPRNGKAEVIVPFKVPHGLALRPRPLDIPVPNRSEIIVGATPPATPSGGAVHLTPPTLDPPTGGAVGEGSGSPLLPPAGRASSD